MLHPQAALAAGRGIHVSAAEPKGPHPQPKCPIGTLAHRPGALTWPTRLAQRPVRPTDVSPHPAPTQAIRRKQDDPRQTILFWADLLLSANV